MTRASLDPHDRRPLGGEGPLPPWLAVVLVTGTSAAVLVLEILAGRLLAPYVGVSIETFTGIIGTILAGIAVGARAGGALADTVDPRRLLPPLLGLGGALAIATVPIVRSLGDALGPGTGANIIVLAACGFLPSATVLSAVPPVVVKLQLRDLSTTGTTVGRLSAYGTAGAIVGTFTTGFVLVAWAAVTTLIVAVGLVCIAAGVGLWFAFGGRQGPSLLGVAAIGGLSLFGVSAVEGPCDTQTRYYCVSVDVDGDRPSGRVLVLDDLRHSYVDLDDPTHLEFWYIRRIVDAIEVVGPDGDLDITYLGGGGLTVPRYVRATRPASTQTVLEIDGDLIELVGDELGYEPGADIDIVIGDGRLSITEQPADSADIVVGDAFGSRAVPFHLATVEMFREIDRVLRPGGVYVANIIDSSAQRFLRAETATAAEVWPHVAVILGPGAAAGRSGNSIIVASDRPLDTAGLGAALDASGDDGALVAPLDEAWTDGVVLTDEFAPVDQLVAGAG